MIHWFLPLPVVIRSQIRAFSKGWLEIGGGIQSFEKELIESSSLKGPSWGGLGMSYWEEAPEQIKAQDRPW